VKWIYASPRLHKVASIVSSALWRDDSWQWCRIESGPARDLWIQAQPRTQKFQVAGVYEPAVTRALAEHPAGTVWDVGAHTGYFVLVALRQGSAVVAIEPDVENATRIRAALARNQLTATVVEAAAGESEGTAFLERAEKTSFNRISDRGTPVQVTTLDTLYARGISEPPTLVKIDVEGFEAEVLRGARRLLRQARPTLLIELHPWGDRQAALEELGDYAISPLADGHVLAVPR
jgi:FkbM family methyltransferase